MKFATRKDAIEFKKSENRLMPSIKLRIVKSTYMGMDTFEFIECFCMVKI